MRPLRLRPSGSHTSKAIRDAVQDAALPYSATRCRTRHCLTALPSAVVTRPHDPPPADNCSRSFSTIGSTHGCLAAYGYRQVSHMVCMVSLHHSRCKVCRRPTQGWRGDTYCFGSTTGWPILGWCLAGDVCAAALADQGHWPAAQFIVAAGGRGERLERCDCTV